MTTEPVAQTVDFTLSVPAEHVTTIGDAFARAYDYPEDSDQSPEAKIAFAQAKVIDYINEIVRADQVMVAVDAARASVAETPVDITVVP